MCAKPRSCENATSTKDHGHSNSAHTQIGFVEKKISKRSRLMLIVNRKDRLNARPNANDTHNNSDRGLRSANFTSHRISWLNTLSLIVIHKHDGKVSVAQDFPRKFRKQTKASIRNVDVCRLHCRLILTRQNHNKTLRVCTLTHRVSLVLWNPIFR